MHGHMNKLCPHYQSHCLNCIVIITVWHMAMSYLYYGSPVRYYNQQNIVPLTKAIAQQKLKGYFTQSIVSSDVVAPLSCFYCV